MAKDKSNPKTAATSRKAQQTDAVKQRNRAAAQSQHQFNNGGRLRRWNDNGPKPK